MPNDSNSLPARARTTFLISGIPCTEKRKSEAERIRAKYPDRIPVSQQACYSSCIVPLCWLERCFSDPRLDWLRSLDSHRCPPTPPPLLIYSCSFRPAAFSMGLRGGRARRVGPGRWICILFSPITHGKPSVLFNRRLKTVLGAGLR